jgi:hypothetical protein
MSTSMHFMRLPTFAFLPSPTAATVPVVGLLRAELCGGGQLVRKPLETGWAPTAAAAASSAPWQHNTASSDGAFLLDLMTTGTLAVRSNLPTALHSGARLHQHAVSNWRHALVLPSH